MRRSQKKEVMKKLTVLIGQKLIEITASKKWTGREISEHTGVSENRISEIKNPRHYKRPITEGMFGQFLTGGVIRPFDINLIEDLSEKERKYINELIKEIYVCS